MSFLKKLNHNWLIILISVAIIIVFIIGCKEVDNAAPSDGKQITTFKFESISPVVNGSIDETTHSILLEVPVGTNITSLIPTITLSDNAMVSPASGKANNFASKANYTVTAQNGSTQVYEISVVSPDKQIASFKIDGLNISTIETIDQNNHTIVVKVPYNTDVTSLTPTILILGKEISPASGIAQNFTTPVTYTVTASNGTTQTYSVKVETSPINIASINWTSAGFNFNYISCLTVSGKDIFVGSSGGINRSSNGSTWTSVASGTTIPFVKSITVSGSNIYVGTNTNIYLSNNNGSTWSSLSPLPESKPIFSILANGSTIVAAAFGGGIYLSTNSGANWEISNNGLTSLSIISLEISGTNLLATTSNSDGSFLSSDAGANWTLISTLTSAYDFATIGTNCFAATKNGVYISVDNGKNWTASNSGLTDLNVITIFSKDGNLLAGTTNGSVFLSTNNGGSWTSISKGLPTDGIIAIDIKGSIIFAATSFGIFSSPL